MATCSVCGNDYDKAFTVQTVDGNSQVFDSLECAVQGIAPRCAHCNCAVLGHGVESGRSIYCCRHCLEKKEGASPIADRV